MSQLADVLSSIYERVQQRPDLEESEVTDVFTDNDFFETLGYEGIPIDVRSENHIVGGDRPDYFAKDKYSNTIFVVEFKKPSRSEDLASHKDQLWEQYVVPLSAKYGILTDGQELIFYERDSRNRRRRKFRVQLDSVSDEQVSELQQLEKPDYSFDSTEEVKSYFETADSVSVGELVDGEPVGRNEFLDTFRLEKNTIFYEMLERTYNLLTYYLEQDEESGTSFPTDAYEFWRSYYASDPSWYDLPKEWREIAGKSANKQKVMFAVETVQSMLGRLMLAKACEDYNFPNVSISKHIEEETMDFRGRVPPIAYIDSGRSLMQKMREELVESVFEQDIYYWWNQPAEEIEDMSPKEVVNTDWDSEIDDFGKSLVEFTISMARFDFSSIRGDPLGELYQQYFDSKTRRALGEFYTPPSVCEYIVDSTGYGSNPQYRRLIDPACGSGTFLMTALDTYKDSIEDDPQNALRDLCNRGRIVGLDIHPFAVVLAQIRFMLEILEEYKRAIEKDPNLVLRRLPIFRTDSLLDESEAEEGVQQTLSASYDEGKVEFTMPLPIRRGGDFESMDFEFPRFNHVQSETAGEISNQQQYFSALCAVFDAVKERAEDDNGYTIELDELTEYFYDYFARERNVAQIAGAFHETANGFMEVVRTLREDYNDGRLLKLIEDVVLGATLKNDIKYDYVVGNPPWVSKHSRHPDDNEERRAQQLYLSAWKETDPYLQFTERGMGMLQEGGTIGFLVSSRYLTTGAGKEIRALLAKNRIQELVDFTDYALFEDAMNYSSIIVAEKQVPNDDWESFIEDGRFANQHDISAARIRDWDGDIPSLVEQMYRRESTPTVDFFSLDSSRLQERVYVRSDRVETEEVSQSFDTADGSVMLTRYLPQADVWPLSPPLEYQLIDQVESTMEMRLGDKTVIRDNEPERIPNLVGDAIHEGVATSGDGAYLVKPTTKIQQHQLAELNQLTVEPQAVDKTYTVETDLLRIDIKGEDAERWLPDWKNRLVFIPYKLDTDPPELIKPKILANRYPLTWAYFSDEEVLKTLSDESLERKELHARLAAEFDIIDEKASSSEYREVTLSASDFRELSTSLADNPGSVQNLDDDFWWYRFMYRKKIEVIPEPKVMPADLVQYNKLSFDDEGIMAPHNVSVYAILLPEEDKRAMAGILNSALIEFYHKQHSRVHGGKAYRYIEDHTSQWPVIRPTGEVKSEIEEYVNRILQLKNLEIKVSQFPDPYIADFREEGEEFTQVSFSASSSYTASPTLQTDLSNQYVIEVGDDRINDDAIDSEAKARYVMQALDVDRSGSDQSISIHVPLADGIAEDALEELSEDREILETSSISDLEANINEIVFDLYGVESERYRELIRRYNNQYETVQALDPEAEF
jgi:type I restriction-modification system DNA methylase subunit